MAAPDSRAPRQSRKRKYTTDPLEEEILSVIKHNVGRPPHTTDSDEMFLLSQIPVIKKFSQADKLDFQVKFLQLVQSYAERSLHPPASSNTALLDTTPINLPSCSYPSVVTGQSPVGSNVGSEWDTDDSVISFVNL